VRNLPAKRKKWRLRRVLKRMRLRSRKGSAAIEFAFIAPVLFVLIMGVIEVGIIFFAQFLLQSATDDAARLIRTGQVASSSMTQTEFRQYICDKVSALMSCDSNLLIDVESYSTFASTSYTSALNSDGTLDTDALNNYSIGDVCSVVLVRTFYTWSVATPLLTTFLVNMANDMHLLSSAAAFRNEPYSTSVSGC
jgi:Flp pilus assembly protein TadG